MFLPWTQNITGQGLITTLTPDQRPQTLQSQIPGRIEQWYVREGDYVEKGDTILRISEVKSEYFDDRLIERTNDQISANTADENQKNWEREWEIDNLPNRLTMFRMLLIPIILSSLMFARMDYEWVQGLTVFLGYVAGWTFCLASVTDFFDGYIARKRGIVTVFGSFLDPIADKFLVVSSLILLGELERVPTDVVLILVLREI